MSGSAPFRLNRSGMLLALISAAFAGQAQAAAGRIDFISGGVTVARDGRERPLAKGAELDSGDTIKTANDGRAQIRFTDGSYVSLQPNSDFAISEYKYDGKTDGSERGFYGLVKGAMRTVTGAIGRVNRNAYRVTTPTATVGIRGTGGVIQVLNDGSTLIIGTSGIWSLTNPAGSIDVPAGVSGLAPTEPNTPPRETNTQPQSTTPPVQPTNEIYTQGNNVNPDGTPDLGLDKPLTYVPLVSATGYRVSSVHTDASGAPVHTFVGNQNATFDSVGQMTAFGTTNIGSGTHADFGSDGILAWGRWIGTVNVAGSPVAYAGDQGYHYVVGMPTPAMPTAGNATYSLAGATRPTYMTGGVGMVTGGTMCAAFTSFSVTTTLTNLTVAMPGQTYVMNGFVCASGSTFSMSPSTTGCATTCSSTVMGFFSGASAERIGIGYSVADGGQRVFGAAAFAK